MKLAPYDSAQKLTARNNSNRQEGVELISYYNDGINNEGVAPFKSLSDIASSR